MAGREMLSGPHSLLFKVWSVISTPAKIPYQIHFYSKTKPTKTYPFSLNIVTKM